MTTYTDTVERELLEKCAEIPFENSLFQDEAFIVNASYTDGRALRNVGLKLSAKVRALRELEFSMERLSIDLDEIKVKLKHGDLTSFDMRRLEVDRRQKLSGIEYTKKLTHDCIVEVEYLRALLAKLPTMTRGEFEAQERSYFQQSLGRQAIGMPEAAKSLETMGEALDMPALPCGPISLVSERLGVTVDGFLSLSGATSREDALKLLARTE